METGFATFTAFLGKFKRKKPEAPKKDTELLRLIRETQEELSRCRKNLMFADTEALTDMYIYSIKASEMRYAHLLRLAKKAAG